MTNSEYEAGSCDRFEGEHKLKQCDKAIAVLEESLARLQAERREIVNRYDLNKCEHKYTWDSAFKCTACGTPRPSDVSSSGDDSWDTDRRPGSDVRVWE